MLKCRLCSEHNFKLNYMKPVSKIDKPISALRYRCLNTVLQVEIYIYIVNISTCSLFMLDMYQIN